MDLKNLEHLAEVSPQACRQKIEASQLDQTAENLKKIKIEVLAALAEAELVLELDFWLTENKYILTSTAYQNFREKILKISTFKWLLYDAYLDVVEES